MTIAVVGAGYVGLTTAACFASLGHDVVCADIDEERIRSLRKGEVPLREEGLAALVGEGLEARRLHFVVGAAAAARDALFVFLCVPTPTGPDGPDLSFVASVAREVAPVLRPGSVVVNKSTTPPGSTRVVERILAEAGASVDEIRVASNPEFLREGTAVRDFLQPSRIVIGGDDPVVAVRVSELYRGVPAPLVVTDAASAEMIKYASNAFLATKISFINAIANLCESLDADVRDVTLGMGYDGRIGSEFLHPGPGYGGSCFPKDIGALIHAAAQTGSDFSLLEAVVDVNDRQHARIVEKVRDAAGGDLAGVSVAAWGLTFKANTDDLRDSPALEIVGRLLAAGARVRAYDPAAGDQVTTPGIEVVADPYTACAGARVLAVLTEWDEFRWLDFGRVAEMMSSPVVVDGRNLLDAAALRHRGFQYTGVGR
ncbi:MAG: UDP-glucose dehydrogenase family protein [Acidimicrobiia bacterium]